MPRKPDTPCAGCGKLLYGGRGALPSGQRTCLDCRRARSADREIDKPGRLLWPHNKGQTCSDPECDMQARTRGRCKRHYTRWYYGPGGPGESKTRGYVDVERRRATWRAKNHRRRGVSRGGDFTAADEIAMRRKAKRCPLCGIKLADEPFLPASKELDHILPRNVGGTHTHGNLRIICKRCNAARPLDGSDFVGQLSLWAQDPVAVIKQPKRALRCAHGVGRSTRCYDCRPLTARGRREDGRRAAELRADGWRWKAVAAETGFGIANVVTMARRWGDPEVVAKWHVADSECRQCGIELPLSSGRGRPRRFCAGCRPAVNPGQPLLGRAG